MNISQCMVCKVKPANHHITGILPDGSQKRLDLCEDCARQRLPEGVQAPPPSPAGRVCDFCGSPATTASAGLGLEMFWCTDCGLELGQIVQARYDRLSKEKAPVDSEGWTKTLWSEAEQILRQRLEERKKLK
jgi:protein-arginine kinase activator protein McsA